MGILGVVVLLALAFLCSSARSSINWRVVSFAFLTQLLIALFTLKVPFGQKILLSLTNFFSSIIGAGEAGITFVFGPLADTEKVGFIFICRVLPIIIFVSSLVSVLYYLKVMPFIIKNLGKLLSRIIGASRTECFSAAANIFVGQTEAPLVIKPYLAKMTRSELFAVMVGGLASIAGSVMAGLSELGVPLQYLIASCFMSAPAGLLFAKLLLPETESREYELDAVQTEDEAPANMLDAAATGAATGAQLAINVGAMLLAFIGLIALTNEGLAYVGQCFNISELSLQSILGVICAPVAWLIGVPWSEAQSAGSLLGQKLVINEFVAFVSLAELSDLSERSKIILTFSLCGFANFGSIAVLLGGLGGMVPSRREEIAKLALKSLFAATLANLLSGALAGIVIG